MKSEIERNRLGDEILRAITSFGQRQAQLNLRSESARKLLADEITIGVLGKFYFAAYTNDSSYK